MEASSTKRLDGGGSFGEDFFCALIILGDKDDLERCGCGLECGEVDCYMVELETRPFPFDSGTPVLYTVSSYVGQSREMNNIREEYCTIVDSCICSNVHYRLCRAE